MITKERYIKRIGEMIEEIEGNIVTREVWIRERLEAIKTLPENVMKKEETERMEADIEKWKKEIEDYETHLKTLETFKKEKNA